MTKTNCVNLGDSPQKGWKQKQETEIETKKSSPKLAHAATPLCFRFSKTQMETVFKGGGLWGWQSEKILEQILFLLVSVSNSYEVGTHTEKSIIKPSASLLLSLTVFNPLHAFINPLAKCMDWSLIHVIYRTEMWRQI